MFPDKTNHRVSHEAIYNALHLIELVAEADGCCCGAIDFRQRYQARGSHYQRTGLWARMMKCPAIRRSSMSGVSDQVWNLLSPILAMVMRALFTFTLAQTGN